MQKLLFFLLIISSVCIADIEKPTMVYRYWDFGSSEKRDKYQFELLSNILEKTSRSHGKYELIKVEKKFTSTRASREISRGEIINIEASPHHPPFLNAPLFTENPANLKDSKYAHAINDPKINIPKPLLRGLLGYRKLIVRREDLEKFNGIKTADELKNLVAGQGKDWEDVSIYKYNNYKVSESSDIDNLFPMLLAKRFDYIALSIIEVNDVLKDFDQYSDDVAIVPHIIIYYPFPVLFNLSIHHPELAERVDKGLAIVEADGTSDRLFKKYFSDEIKNLQDANNKVFMLKNPNIPNSLGLESPLLTPAHKN